MEIAPAWGRRRCPATHRVAQLGFQIGIEMIDDGEVAFDSFDDDLLFGRMANDCGKEGSPSVVTFQKRKMTLKRIWTYGEDQYPPAKSDLPSIQETLDALG